MPSNENFSPGGVDQSPVTIASCSSNRSNRSLVPGKGIPYAACSASNQPAPRPSSALPPDIASTCATSMASTPGSRNVAGLTSVPRRIRFVSRARPASVTQASVEPGSPLTSPMCR